MNDVQGSTDFIAEAITEAFGERCPDYAEGCACCEAWSQYDALAAKDAELERVKTALEPFVATRDQAIGEMVKTISKARDGFTPITVTVTKTQYLAAWDAVASQDQGEER